MAATPSTAAETTGPRAIEAAPRPLRHLPPEYPSLLRAVRTPPLESRDALGRQQDSAMGERSHLPQIIVTAKLSGPGYTAPSPEPDPPARA